MEGKKHTVTLAGFLITIIGSILFSTKAIIVKVAFANTSMNALTLLTLRMTFSLPFYLGAVWLARQKDPTPLTTRQWMAVVGLGLFGYYLSSLFDFVGLQYVTAGLERLILFLYPTFAVLINAFIFKQPVVRTQKIALLLTYTGILIAYIGELRIGDIGNPHFIWGSFLIFFVLDHLQRLYCGQRQADTNGGRYAFYSLCNVIFHSRGVCSFRIEWQPAGITGRRHSYLVRHPACRGGHRVTYIYDVDRDETDRLQQRSHYFGDWSGFNDHPGTFYFGRKDLSCPDRRHPVGDHRCDPDRLEEKLKTGNRQQAISKG